MTPAEQRDALARAIDRMAADLHLIDPLTWPFRLEHLLMEKRAVMRDHEVGAGVGGRPLRHERR